MHLFPESFDSSALLVFAIFLAVQNTNEAKKRRIFRNFSFAVVDLDGKVTGVITRKDLAFFDTRLQQRQRKSAQAEDSSGALSPYLLHQH
jgi:hypothetical protein